MTFDVLCFFLFFWGGGGGRECTIPIPTILGSFAKA